MDAPNAYRLPLTHLLARYDEWTMSIECEALGDACSVWYGEGDAEPTTTTDDCGWAVFHRPTPRNPLDP